MQKLQINLRNGQTLVVANNAPDNKAVPLFARFLDALRMSAPTHTDVFVFDDPVLLVRLSEVSAASVNRRGGRGRSRADAGSEETLASESIEQVNNLES